MISDGHDIYVAVLEDLHDGVVVVEFDGTIQVFNPAACRILDLLSEHVIGKVFAETFIAHKRLEEFAQSVLDAIGRLEEISPEVIQIHNHDGELRSLSIASSYLTLEEDGVLRPVAVIAVFADITEIRELRETEIQLARDLEHQHTELQQAYREIEERNRTMSDLLRKVQFARSAATIFVILLFVGAGFYAWQPLGEMDDDSKSGEFVEAFNDNDAQTVIIKPSVLDSTISLIGHLGPWRTFAMTSPFDGRLKHVTVQIGQEVKAGETLVQLDTTMVEEEYRNARIEYLRALAEYNKVSDRENSTDMSNARRAFSRAKLAYDSQQSRLTRAKFLYSEGLVSLAEVEEARRQFESQTLDFESAKEDLEQAQQQGGKEAVEVAELELNTTRNRMQAFKIQLDAKSIQAPIDGVVLQGNISKNALTAGQTVKLGAAILLIGISNACRLRVRWMR